MANREQGMLSHEFPGFMGRNQNPSLDLLCSPVCSPGSSSVMKLCFLEKPVG